MILVTGGAGFIGSNLVAALAESGRRVAMVDRLGNETKWRNLAKHPVEAIASPAEIDRLLGEIGAELEAIVHLGAISSTTETDADLLIANNFTLSCKLWNWATSRELPYIYASSAATYGDGSNGFDDDPSLDYMSKLRPLNAYGWSKLLFDRWVMARISRGEPGPPQWAGLRFFNVYGPNEYHKGAQGSVAWHLFEQISAGKPAQLFKSHHPDYKDGGQLRDFVWVGDCVAVMLWLLGNPEQSGLFNLGTGKARSFLDLARAVFTAMRKEEQIKFVATPKEIRDKYQYFTEARMERLRDAGYNSPFLTLEDGVSHYVRDFLMKEDAYR